MKACDQWREKLTDCALGAPPNPALTRHLHGCPVCSAALRELQARLREIDDGTRQIVASDPFANAADRILANVAAPVRQQRWPLRAKAAVAALTGAAILAASVGLARKLREKRTDFHETLSAATSISNWRSPTQDLLRSPYDAVHEPPPRLGEYFFPVKTGTSSANHHAPTVKEKRNP